MVKKKKVKKAKKGRVISKRILKKQKPMTLDLRSQREPEEVLDDKQRFFTGQVGQQPGSLYFK